MSGSIAHCIEDTDAQQHASQRNTLLPAPDEPSAHSVWGTAIRFTLLGTALLGIAYPFAVTGIATAFFPHHAAGSLIYKDGQVIGSELIAQSFTSDKYFHPRPSAAGNGYDATASGGSNLAQSSRVLVDRIQSSIDSLQKQNPGKPVPIDLVTTSASGLDPDITPDAAYFQIDRIAAARNLDKNTLTSLVEKHIQGRQFGFLGEPRVNVLELNLALDKLSQ